MSHIPLVEWLYKLWPYHTTYFSGSFESFTNAIFEYDLAIDTVSTNDI